MFCVFNSYPLVRTAGAVLGEGMSAFLSDWDKVLAAAGGVSLLALGVYTARGGVGITARYIENRLGKPSLVRETSRFSLFDALRHPWSTVRSRLQKTESDALAGVVLEPGLEARLRCAYTIGLSYLVAIVMQEG